MVVSRSKARITTLTFKYKKEAQAYCNELSGAVSVKRLSLMIDISLWISLKNMVYSY